MEISQTRRDIDTLGETIDIHGGGRDLIFPHHENEIAQSEALTGKELSKYWSHCGLIKLNGEKTSEFSFTPEEGMVIQVGKGNVFKLKKQEKNKTLTKIL